MPVVGIEAWVTQVPPITRSWLALAVLTSVAVVRLFSFGIRSPVISCLLHVSCYLSWGCFFDHLVPHDSLASERMSLTWGIAMSTRDATTAVLQLQ